MSDEDRTLCVPVGACARREQCAMHDSSLKWALKGFFGRKSEKPSA